MRSVTANDQPPTRRQAARRHAGTRHAARNTANRLDLKPGDPLLIRGGTSTVGLSAATIAKDLGATVLFTTRGPERATDLPADVLARQLQAIAAGRLDVPVAKVHHGLEQVRGAQADVESGTTPGKHVVVLGD